MIAAGLATHLRNDAGVSAVVGTRIFPQIIPQHDYYETTKHPCLVYQLVNAIRQPLFCSTDSVVQQSVQIDCYSRSYKAVQELAASVRAALIDYSGLMGGIAVKKVLADTEFDGLDEEPGLFRVTQFFTVWFVDT